MRWEKQSEANTSCLRRQGTLVQVTIWSQYLVSHKTRDVGPGNNLKPIPRVSEDKGRWSRVVLLLDQRRRWRPNSKTTLDQSLVLIRKRLFSFVSMFGNRCRRWVNFKTTIGERTGDVSCARFFLQTEDGAHRWADAVWCSISAEPTFVLVLHRTGSRLKARNIIAWVDWKRGFIVSSN